MTTDDGGVTRWHWGRPIGRLALQMKKTINLRNSEYHRVQSVTLSPTRTLIWAYQVIGLVWATLSYPIDCFLVIDIAWDRVFYEIYRHEHEGEAPRASCHVYFIKYEDFSCYNYVFYITTTPYLPCNNKNINRKDFYYTAITLTTGYKWRYDLLKVVHQN